MIALVLAAALAAKLPQPAPAPCPHPVMRTDHAGPQAQAQKLADLPDAAEIRAVIRRIGGCDYMDVLRFNVSDPSSPALPHVVRVPAGGAIEPAKPTADH